MDVNTFNLKMMTQLTAGFQETKNGPMSSLSTS